MTHFLKQCRGGTLHLVKIPKKYGARITNIAEQALTKAMKLFAYHEQVETVIFSSIPEFVIPELGIGAHAILQGDIVVNIDFSRRNVKRTIENELSSTLYHEFSHIVRASVVKNLFATLGESLVTEGIASYVEKKIFLKSVPYIEPIENEEKYLLQAYRGIKRKTYDHSEWFYGTKKLPRWIGYRLGYLLIDALMKQHQNLPFSQLIRVKSHNAIHKSQFFRSVE